MGSGNPPQLGGHAVLAEITAELPWRKQAKFSILMKRLVDSSSDRDSYTYRGAVSELERLLSQYPVTRRRAFAFLNAPQTSSVNDAVAAEGPLRALLAVLARTLPATEMQLMFDELETISAYPDGADALDLHDAYLALEQALAHHPELQARFFALIDPWYATKLGLPTP